MTEPNVVATAPTPSLWEDFVDIFASPAAVFRRRENGSWFIPLLILTIIVVIISLAGRGVMQPLFDAEFERTADALRKNPQVTEDAIARAKSVSEFFRLWGPLVITPVAVIILGIMTWLVAKLVDARQTLTAALVVASYSLVPRVVQGIVNLVQAAIMSPDKLTSLVKISFSPARFVNPDTTSPLVVQLLNRFDLFTIWVTVLLAIGVYVTGRVTKQRAAIAGVLFWIVGAIPAILGAIQQQAARG